MSNAVELLVKIGIDTSKKVELQEEINKLGKSLEGLKVDIKFDKEAIKSLNEIAKMDFSKLTQSINGIKSDLQSIGKESKQVATITADQFKQAGKDIDTAFAHMGKNFQTVTKKGVHDLNGLKEAFKGMDATFKIDNKVLENGANKTATKEIDAVTVAYKNLQGQMEKVKMEKVNVAINKDDTKSVFLPAGEMKAIDNQIAKMAQLGVATQKSLDTMRINGKLTEAQFKELSAAIGKVGTVDGFTALNQKILQTANAQKALTEGVKAGQAAQEKHASKMASSADAAIQKLTKLRSEGKITDDQFAKLSDRISKIGHAQGFTLLNQRIEETVAKQKQIVAGQKEQEQAQIRLANNELKRLNHIADIERAMRNHSKTIDSMNANRLLEDMKRMDASSKNFTQNLRQNQSAFRELRQNANEAERANTGVIGSFKQAMEKFPIWLAASTIFFGVSRTAREFGAIIVDIDAKMTGLTKVMSDNTDFEGLFNSATEAAERFGQSISQVLDSYNEFAKQGFKGDELAGLADAGLVASNVGDITAQKASEYMTASLIQWKKDASEAMGIIDS